jgi:uncharacterized protein YfaP (DUF2135 family)
MKKLCLPLLLLPACAMAQVSIESPKSGWRHSGGSEEQYTQTVNYPASVVNMQPGQAETAQIRGKIAGAGRNKPAKLIVNGVAMPVELQEDGSFARPYIFGPGSNGVEVRSPDGKSRARSQFYDSYSGKTKSRLRVVLSWDSPGTDVDLHVITPNGGHSWFGQRMLPDGSGLDVDVTGGYGPEIYSSPAPAKGNYHVYVNYFGGNSEKQVITVATVSIITNENTPSEKQQTFMVPLRAPGELTLVKSFVYP